MMVHAQDHLTTAMMMADQAGRIPEHLSSVIKFIKKGGFRMRIMLACCAGMSTSLVVSKMQEAAREQGKDYKNLGGRTGPGPGRIRQFRRPAVRTAGPAHPAQGHQDRR